MLQIRDVKGEAVVTYRESLTTKEMRYHRLSRRVRNMTNQIDYLGVHVFAFLETFSKYAKILAIIVFVNLFGMVILQ